MRKIIFLQIFISSLLFSNTALAVENADTALEQKKTTKENTKDKPDALQGLITQPKIEVEVREKMVAEKELELARREKKINDDTEALDKTRKQLVQEALNVKAALNAREKEITQKAVATKGKKAKKYPDATKKFSDLLNNVTKQNPVVD